MIYYLEIHKFNSFMLCYETVMQCNKREYDLIDIPLISKRTLKT